METIKLKQNGIIKIGILDADGNDTGNFLEFDTEDIELPLRLDEVDKMHKKNVEELKAQQIIINKKQDEKGKGILTKNEIEKYKVLKEFYNKEIEALNLFLGENGVQKILNGRHPYLTMYDDIVEYLQPIIPKITGTIDNTISNIKNKYNLKEITEEDVLKLDD